MRPTKQRGIFTTVGMRKGYHFLWKIYENRAVNLTRLQIWRIGLPRPAITKRLTEVSLQGKIRGFSGVGGGGGENSTVPETTLNSSEFIVRKSSIRQIANFVNYPGDY